MPDWLKEKMKDCVGKRFPTNQFGEVEVVEYKDYKNVLVKFINTGTLSWFRADHIKNGRCRDKYAPTVFGKGVVGDNVTTVNGVTTKLYNLWSGMLERCYSETFHKKYPSYKDCSVTPDWCYLDNFKVWFEENYKEGFELDKDLLVYNNKMYSPETCVFVPKTLNNLIKYNKTLKKRNLPTSVVEYSGKYYSYTSDKQCLGGFSTPEEAFKVYKNWKEDRIKCLAEKYYKDCSIPENLFKALISYEVKDYV
jgi:hypothetical protein|tara:strand:+ start:6245 stop:6997 length:753 start_codon:yes stop_codon:yes gene_type:complete